MNHNWYSWMLFVVTVCVNMIHLSELVLATHGNSNPGTYIWPPIPDSLYAPCQPTQYDSKCATKSSSECGHTMREMQPVAGHSTRIFPAPFPERSGTKVSYRVSVSTFQLPIIEQIALNQIYLHGLFFVIWVQSDYRITTELCLK